MKNIKDKFEIVNRSWNGFNDFRVEYTHECGFVQTLKSGLKSEEEAKEWLNKALIRL